MEGAGPGGLEAMKFFGEVEGKNCVWGETFCRDARWKIGNGAVGAAKRRGSFRFQVFRNFEISGTPRTECRMGETIGCGSVVVWGR